MICARTGCDNELPPQRPLGRKRIYCSDDCRYDDHRVVCAEAEVQELMSAVPRVEMSFEQHERGACGRCRRERWLYCKVGEHRRLCSACLLRSIVAPADHEISDGQSVPAVAAPPPPDEGGADAAR